MHKHKTESSFFSSIQQLRRVLGHSSAQGNKMSAIEEKFKSLGKRFPSSEEDVHL